MSQMEADAVLDAIDEVGLTGAATIKLLAEHLAVEGERLRPILDDLVAAGDVEAITATEDYFDAKLAEGPATVTAYQTQRSNRP
jgi:hypothetical protein